MPISRLEKKDIGAICLLVILTLLFFMKIFISGETLYGSDFLFYFYPLKHFIFETLWSEHSIPLWNPYLFSGTPFITNIQASMFYPLGFLYYLLPPDTAYLFSTVLHCALGAVFMYFFARSLSISKAGAFLSGVIFIFNGYFMAHLYAGHLSFVQNYIWIPLIFLFCWRFIQGDQYKYAVFGGLTLGVQILGGFPQIAFYTILGTILFAVYHSVQSARDRHYRHAIRIICGAIVIVVLGFSLSAVQLLPTLEFTGLSTRSGGVSYDFAVYDSLNPRTLISFLLPEFFGNAVDNTYWWSNDVWHFWETCGYVGILPVLLVFVNMGKEWTKRGMWLFFLGLVVFSVFLALGKHNGIYPIIYKLPGFNSFRIPAQIIFLYVFALAILSGMVVDRLSKNEAALGSAFISLFLIIGCLLVFLEISLSLFPNEMYDFLFNRFANEPARGVPLNKLYGQMTLSLDKGMVLFFLSAILIIVKVKNWLAPRAFAMSAVAMVILDLYTFVDSFVIPFDYSTSQAEKEMATQLNKEPFEGRILVKDQVMWPNDALRFGFPSITGYDPLILKRYVHYIQTSQHLKKDDHVVHLSGVSDPNSPFLSLLNLKTIVSKEGIRKLKNEGRYAHMVGEAVIKSPDHILSFMQSERFDADKMIVLEEVPGQGFLNDFQAHVQARVEIVEYKNEKIEIRTASNRAAYLVLSEIFYPGWEATVDGRDSPVLRANYLYRAIPLDKGEHDVTLRFISWPFRLGLLISLTVLMGSLWFIWRQRKVR